MAKVANKRLPQTHSAAVHRLCLTGGAASGKTTALLRLEREGYATLDSTCLASRLLLGNRTLWRQFSDWALLQGLPEQALADRYAVAKSLPYLLQLAQTSERKMPEAVRTFFSVQLRKEVNQFLFSSTGALVRVVEDPLVFEGLFEMNSQHLYDEIWSLQSSVATQQQRMQQAALLPHKHLALFVKEAFLPEASSALPLSLCKKRLVISNEASWQAFHEELNYQVRNLRQHLLFERHYS
jgi:dephospho-CoA kinase